MTRANARNWDARTAVHVGSEFYDLAGLQAHGLVPVGTHPLLRSLRAVRD